MASNPAFVQYALKTCEKHMKKELTSFCKTCDKKICTSCVKEDHITHDWDVISEFARQKRRELPQVCDRLKTEDIVELSRQVDVYDSLISEIQSDAAKSEDKLNEERKSLIGDINKTYDKKISENRKCTAETIQQYHGRKEKLQQKIQYLDKMTNALGTENDTFTDHDLIEMEQELMTELNNAKSYNAENCSHCNVFVPGKINMEVVVEMTGEVHNITTEEASTLKSGSSEITTISPKSQDTAWVGGLKRGTANLIRESGEKSKCLRFHYWDLIFLQNGGIARTHYGAREIILINDREELIQKINTKPLHPTWLNKTENNEILVTLRDGGNRYNLLPTSRRIVQRMTLTGEVLHTYEFEKDGKTRLFTSPGKAFQNKNTDVCVINGTSINSGHLVVLQKGGDVKLTYNGHCKPGTNFHPFDVTCDSKCCIIISDMYSKSLHLLSSSGQFIGMMFSFNSLPHATTFVGDKLWVGFSDGTIKVFRYKSF